MYLCFLDLNMGRGQELYPLSSLFTETQSDKFHEEKLSTKRKRKQTES